MNKLKGLLFLMALFLISSSLFYISNSQKKDRVIHNAILQVEKKIALDLPLLDLSNEFFKHSGNKEAVARYISVLNENLTNVDIKVVSITSSDVSLPSLKSGQVARQLKTNDDIIKVVFDVNTPLLPLNTIFFYTLFFLFSIGMTLWLITVINKHRDNKLQEGEYADMSKVTLPVLIFNLNSKTIQHSYNPEHAISLANKPLCFYLALVEYCTTHSDVVLNNNKDVPDELIVLANKYFNRLIELGHTIRKRPNFNNSLEKTLSEIRAALDDILNDFPQEKQRYYPPKAFGEGSRSRLHSYSLTDIKKESIEIIGK